MAFAYRLEHEDGTPAEPPALRTAVPNWQAGNVILLRHRSLRVVDVRLDEGTGRDRWKTDQACWGCGRDSRTPKLGRCYPAARRYPQRSDFYPRRGEQTVR